MAGLGTQSAIERAELVTPRLLVRAPCFYPNGPCLSSNESGFSGEPVTRLRRAARQQGHAWPGQNKLLHRGRPRTRGTEVVAQGGEEVGGLHTSFDAGELIGNSDPAEQRRPVLM